jgi:hypothetical protein
MPLPDPLLEVLTVFRPLFTAPTWRKLMILLTGTLLTRDAAPSPQRCVRVATVWRATGVSFTRCSALARWSPLAVSRHLLLLIVETFVPAGV